MPESNFDYFYFYLKKIFHLNGIARPHRSFPRSAGGSTGSPPPTAAAAACPTSTACRSSTPSIRQSPWARTTRRPVGHRRRRSLREEEDRAAGGRAGSEKRKNINKPFSLACLPKLVHVFYQDENWIFHLNIEINIIWIVIWLGCTSPCNTWAMHEGPNGLSPIKYASCVTKRRNSYKN